MEIFYVKTNDFSTDSKYENEHILGRKIVEYTAKNIYKSNNCEIEIIKNKPQFKTLPTKFSISHTKGFVVVCFDEFEIGFDAEFIKQRDYKAICKRMNFNLKEDNLENFYKVWTEYEATYKLGTTAKSKYSFIFDEKYAITIASAENQNIKDTLKITQIFL